MEKWKSWAIGIGAGWVLLAFVSWQVESKCGVFFSKACLSEFLEWARWIILFKWVNPYQQLLAGIAAIFAGFFVLLAAKNQIKHDREQRSRAQLEEISNHLNLVANYFWLASKEFRFQRDGGLEILSKAESLAYYTTQCNPNLSDIMLTSIQIVKDRCATSTGHVKRTCSLLFGVSCIFADASKLLKKRNNGLSLSKAELKFPAKKIQDYLDGIEGDRRHLHYLAEYFEFDKLDASESPKE